LWFVIQLLALSVAVITPAFLKSRPDQSTKGNFNGGEASTMGKVTTLLPVKSANDENREAAITSQVLLLPNPATSSPAAFQSDYELSSRQLRFERVAQMREVSNDDSLRSPSSLKSPDSEWILDRIERKDPRSKSWESISLIRGESNNPIGSIYVELFNGENEFQIRFKNNHGSEKSYGVKIRHMPGEIKRRSS
jgi:hypothetical protein